MLNICVKLFNMYKSREQNSSMYIIKYDKLPVIFLINYVL